MKKYFIGSLMLTSISAFADNSITLNMPDATGFGTDTYTIPSVDGETIEQSLIVLANVLPRDACYTGNVAKVKVMLDSAIESAKNVRKYLRFSSNGNLSVDLTVYNKNIGGNQRNQIVIEQCKTKENL